MTTPLDRAIITLTTYAPDGEVNQHDHLTFVAGSQDMFGEDFFGIDDAVEMYRDDGRVPVSPGLMREMDFD